MVFPRHILLFLGLIAGGLLLSAAGTTTALAKPQRIVSLNVCTDQMLLMLAAPDRIKSLSYVATDPYLSSVPDEARKFHLNYGAAEEILPLEPDLVVAGQYTTRATVTLLKRLKYRVVEMPVAFTLDDIRRNVRIMANAVGEVEKGQAILAAFDRTVGPAPGENERQQAPVAALYWANSYSSGRGTLSDAVIRHAGFRTLADTLGFQGAGYVPMEALLHSRPDVLVVGMMRKEEALAQQVFRHPAMVKTFGDHLKITVPDRYWSCGTPYTARAVRQLRQLRQKMEQGQ